MGGVWRGGAFEVGDWEFGGWAGAPPEGWGKTGRLNEKRGSDITNTERCQRDFNAASVIWCQESVGAVAYVRRSGRSKVVPERRRAWVRLSAILTDWYLWPRVLCFLRMSDDFF